ncbi:MFS transporter [Flavobacterium ustbae]|uniref:hypothetical protein n=1 Tax=Flavobacterium ustbae TaxID=2488790 RepID=UPI000F7B8B44|nr:hypothetical protein [Flavobacterium ustbae]
MDRKTRFFKNTLILQFIPLLLLGLLIVSNFREQKVLKIRQLHPYEFNYGEWLPFIFFAVCCIASLFTLFPKPPGAPEDEAEIVKRKRKENFWKFAFYCNVFLLLIIGGFSILVFQKEPLIIDQPVHFYAIILSRSLLVIIISLVVASFLLATGIYWKTNKSFAVVVLIFSFIIMTASVFFEFIFMVLFIQNSQIYTLTKSGNTVNQEEVYQDYQQSEETDDEGGQTATLLYDSWNSLIKDWGGTEDENEFFGVRKLINTSLQSDDVESDHYYLLHFINNLKNIPNELYSEFETYKPVFYSAVSEETYHTAHFDKIVNALLLAHDDIGGQNDKLVEMYKTMEDDEGNNTSQDKYFSKFEGYFSPETIQKIKELKLSSDDFAYTESDLMWCYGFWARRNNEGNIQETAAILKEIKEHYENPEE